jgi:hypothetical protein
MKAESGEKALTIKPGFRNMAPPFRGGIAQLGERLHGMQEVSGSIPLTSTTETGLVPIV